MHNTTQEKRDFNEGLTTFFNNVKRLMSAQDGTTKSQVRFMMMEAVKVFPKIISILINHMSIDFLIERSIDMLTSPGVQEPGCLLYKLQMMIGLSNGVHFENRDFRSGVLK